jgi:hypothetical protein
MQDLRHQLLATLALLLLGILPLQACRPERVQRKTPPPRQMREVALPELRMRRLGTDQRQTSPRRSSLAGSL